MSKGSFLAFSFWLLAASAFSNSTTPVLWEHVCEPGSEVFACAISNFVYIPGESHSRLIVNDTASTRKVRIGSYWNRHVGGRYRDSILAYDATLHAELQRPRAVEIASGKLRMIEIPLDLEYANFDISEIEHVIVPEQPNGSVYSLRHLSLSHNYLQSIANMSALVNLEMLDLANNMLHHIEEETLRRMSNLSYLIIGRNQLFQLSLDVFPPKLRVLCADLNAFGNVKVSGAHLPALEVLTLSYGRVEELDVGALLAVAPNLKTLGLRSNHFSRQLEVNISRILREAGIAHDALFGQGESDDYDDYSNYIDEYHDDNIHRRLKAKLWENIIAVLLAVVNVTILVWGTVRSYRELRAK